MSNQHKTQTMPTPSGMAPLAQTREQSIADSIESSLDFQKRFPDVDVKEALVKPVVNFVFDLKEVVKDADRKKYETLMAQLFEHLAEPDEAEKYLWKARECLAAYPDIVKQFDDFYINTRPVPLMLAQLHECLSMKRAMVAEMELQESGVAKDNRAE